MAEGLDTPQISRSGRVLKKSAKVKEMEDFDINELDVQGKPRKKSKGSDDFDDFDDKRVAPIKIPKVSLNVQGGQKKSPASAPLNRQLFKNTYGAVKMKSGGKDPRMIYPDSSSDGSKESDSSSVSSDSSSSASSSDESDREDNFQQGMRFDRKSAGPGLQNVSSHEKVVVDSHQYEPPAQYMEQDSDASSDDSEDAPSDSALVIAEDSDDSYPPKKKRGPVKKAPPPAVKRDPNYSPRGRKKATPGGAGAGGRRKPPAVTEQRKTKTPSAYMLFCAENRKKITASSGGSIGLGGIGKKMGEAWQALPEKEKLAWRRKAKRLALMSAQAGSLAASPVKPQSKPASSATASEDLLKGFPESTGTLGSAPIDVAAHLKLLGDSLTVIGQRLIEHEGQLAVSGIYSVLLDTLLCAIGPLLCLTSEITGLETVPQETFQKTLDHIAYFMPGL